MLIELTDIHRVYQVGEETVHALRGVSIAIEKGEWVAIIGQSGSGKSTLMNVIGCLDTPSRGAYRLNGKDVSHMVDDELADIRNKEIGFIFQNFQLLPRETALSNVELPLVYRGVRAKERRARAIEALKAVKLEDRMTHRPNELSGGQRQRVAIARALAGDPSLLLADEPTGNLDSSTGEEIVRLFEQLHQQGHTLVLVTHEPKLAARCPRAIRLSDGEVVADGPGPDVAMGNAAAPVAVHALIRVDLVEGSRIALRSLSAHRLRTVLTTVGVGIGVATLLAILGIIQGLNTSFEKQLETIGPASLYVSRRPWMQMGDWWLYRNRKPITSEQVEAVRAQSTYAVAVAASMDAQEDLSFNGLDLSAVDVTGTTPEYAEVSGYDVVQGRFLTTSDDDNLSSVVVIGSDVAATLFPHSSPLGARMRVRGRPFTVVGVLGPKGKILDENQDLTVLMPLSTFKALHSGYKSHEIAVKVRSPELLDAAEDELVGIMRRARQTDPTKPDDFAINRAEQIASVYQKLTGALYGVAVAIGFITLLVGGIGIMNIMLVSVRERTREIGVRRALGARKRTIVLQFILEAVVVSALGGALGTACGLLGAKIVSWTTPLAATVKLSTVFFGVGFAAAVGLIFGIWPAARAANLDPVEALRHE